jgi:hypothetical protein
MHNAPFGSLHYASPEIVQGGYYIGPEVVTNLSHCCRVQLRLLATYWHRMLGAWAYSCME